MPARQVAQLGVQQTFGRLGFAPTSIDVEGRLICNFDFWRQVAPGVWGYYYRAPIHCPQ
jgi:hypothetical protein